MDSSEDLDQIFKTIKGITKFFVDRNGVNAIQDVADRELAIEKQEVAMFAGHALQGMIAGTRRQGGLYIDYIPEVDKIVATAWKFGIKMAEMRPEITIASPGPEPVREETNQEEEE